MSHQKIYYMFDYLINHEYLFHPITLNRKYSRFDVFDQLSSLFYFPNDPLAYLSIIDCSMLGRRCEDHQGDELDHLLDSMKGCWEPCWQQNYQLSVNLWHSLPTLKFSVNFGLLCIQSMGWIPEALFPKKPCVNISLIQSCSSVSLRTSLSEG